VQAGGGEMRLAESLGEGRMRVHQLRDLVGQRLPSDDELRLGDQVGGVRAGSYTQMLWMRG
jgi:hypothetical protein